MAGEIIIKRARIHRAVISKIKNPNFSLDNTSLISKRDIPLAKQLYEEFKNGDVNSISEKFAAERDKSEFMIKKFLAALIDERVIPIEQIQVELVNKIHDILSNHADCKIVASALQLQKERKIFLFVTADKQDLAPNHYEFLKEHFEINHPRGKYIFPELCNLMFTK